MQHDNRQTAGELLDAEFTDTIKYLSFNNALAGNSGKHVSMMNPDFEEQVANAGGMNKTRSAKR